MSDPVVWGGLPKTQTDATTVDEGIDSKIAAHNADPDAHLGDNAALASHRAAEIIDHEVESVYNTHILPSARTYIAIVDPTNDLDFATLSDAVTYAIAHGGGNIFIRNGDHTIDAQLTIPQYINLQGEDSNNTFIYSTTGLDPTIIFEGQTTDFQRHQTIQDITFVNDGDNFFAWDQPINTTYMATEFINCVFEGGGCYFTNTGLQLFLTKCGVDASGGPSAYLTNILYVTDSTISSSDTHAVFADADPDAFAPAWTIYLDKSYFYSSTGSAYWFTGMTPSIHATSTEIQNWYPDSNPFDYSVFLGCKFSAVAGNKTNIYGNNNSFVACSAMSGADFGFDFIGANNCAVGNVCSLGIIDDGTNTQLAANSVPV